MSASTKPKTLATRVARLEKAVALLQRKPHQAGAATAIPFPKIGTSMHGGIFAGIVAGQNGAEDYALIIGEEFDGESNWQTVNKWAKGLKQHGYTDWDVGSRADWRVAMANVAHLFQKTSYWTNEQHAADSDNAWGQIFSHGGQLSWNKNYKLRARAVRRLPISQFLNLRGAA